MSIESHILTLVEALTANTAALRDVLAASAGTTPAPAESPKPAKAKKEKLTVVEPAPEPAAEPVTETAAPEPEAPAAEEPAPAEAPDWDRATYLLNITEFVKGKLVADGTGKVKADYEKIRETFGVKKAPDLQDSDLPAFWVAIQSL